MRAFYSKPTSLAIENLTTVCVIKWVVFVPPEKGVGSHLGVSLDEVIAIGDGPNDIPLLTSAGLAVTMGNAPDELKAVADHITLDIDHSGVAAAISKFLL